MLATTAYRTERRYHAVVQVVGVHWGAYLERGSLASIPEPTAAYDYTLRPYDLENIGEFTRENVQDWLDKNAGDFSSVLDFRAEVGEEVIDWANEENGVAYYNCMFPE